ncbi:uncharacterized protein K02A2.6-like [Pararge aegeria]|uniref:uncharacterized protein K02A2.6-like n=1 Tax=Pararge aegeria TaxID=116150 RepID=UPI0019D214F1|nr:uncharacterized protein K02A2.6-like [Pararge aegeria]
MRSRIFAETDLNYKRAVELALALEAAERHAEASGSGGTAPGAGPHGAAVAGGAGAAPVQVHKLDAADSGGPRGARQRHCWRCGRQHPAERCKFRQYTCDLCMAKGHLKNMCKNVSERPSQFTKKKKNQFFLEAETENDDSDFYNIQVDGVADKPYVVQIFIQSVPINFEVDTGSKISAINEHMFKMYFQSCEVFECNLTLRSYTGNVIKPIGFIRVLARYVNCNGEERTARALPLYVIPGGGPPILGRAWLRHLQLNNISIRLNHLGQPNTVDETEQIILNFKQEFSDVFAPGLGTCTKKFSLRLKDDEPVFHKARNLPLALREPVEKEIQRLVSQGTIVRVENSDYGTPIVPVIKKCGSIRICGDYKVTINPKLKREPYPLPRIEELYSILSGGIFFSKIDLAHAYEQVILTEDSRPCTAISTHVGTFQYIRTPYGLSCIPEKFQKMMEEVVRGVPNTVVFLDYICVAGADFKSHLRNLREVFQRLQKVGLRIKFEKCEFFKSGVCYLGHIIDRDGLRPDPKKIRAIAESPRPTDVQQLKALVGLVNYYGKFIPNLSNLLHPLYELFKKNRPWNWSANCEMALKKVKNILLSDKILAHYDPTLPIVLSVDSSAYGVGAVLAHRYPDGSERLICCASRTLNAAEKSYSQLDKEALAIFFGVTKNHQYLYGRSFVIRTDHKPLSYIFGEKLGIPQTAASRLQRYAARLAAYDYTVEWVNSAQNGPADCLSRLPLPQNGNDTSVDAYSYLCFLESAFPVNHKDIAEAVKIDPVLRNVYKYIIFGWPSNTDVVQEKPYFNRKDNLYVDSGCIMYNYRIVIPPKFRQYILNELHEGHLGVVKIKNTARSYVYWPGLDGDVEQICKSCAACQQQRDAPPHAPLTPWEFPARPWQRLHADFGEYNGKHYLIIVDAYSKWIEVFQLNSTAAKFVISKFREIFARFGLPLQVVTDGGPPFGSHEIKEYFNRNGIIHNITSPYRPKGNGAAENAVKTVKRCIKKACFEGVEIDAAINKMLFNYRNCEQATTGVAPAVALIGRRLRGRLDILRPDVASRVRSKQLVQIERAGGTQREVQRGDNVFIRNYGRDKTKWVEGQVSDQVGPSSFEVNVPHGTVRRHIDQIIKPARASKRYSLTYTSKDTNGDMTSDFDILPEQPVTAQNSEIISGPERKDHSSDVQSVVKDQVEDDKYELASTS